MGASKRTGALIAGAACLVGLVGACGSSKTSNSTGTGGSKPSSPSSSTASAIPADVNNYNANVSGTSTSGTIYWAQAPQNSPNYIFPMVSPQVCSVANTNQFSAMLYRPLYWFGNNNKAAVDYDYSVGQQPIFTNDDKTVTIHLNDWKWSDGEDVTSADVALWISLYKGDPSANYCGYVAPVDNEKFFPDNVASFTTPDSHTIVLNLTQSYNPNWFLYNELAQITPIPMSWDATSLATVGTNKTGSGVLSQSAGEAVYKFLDTQSKNTTTYTSSPIWSTVDGPWKLSGFSATGQVTMVPNTSYSGSPKPTASQFVEVPYTDNSAEVTALKTGGPNSVTFGYLPPEDAPQRASIQSEGYSYASSFALQYVFFPLNLSNPSLGPTFKQLYFRQAFEHVVDQEGWIKSFLNSWAIPDYGPIPPQPPSSFTDSEEANGPYQFSIADAKQILTSHGWTEVGGVMTCTDAGSGANQCGTGVAKGTALSFNLDYASGIASLTSEMQDLESTAAQAGIKLSLTQHTFSDVIAAATPCTTSTAATCKWTAENWGGGWVYDPDFYPSGESLFLTGAAANYESYSDPTADSLILKTTTAPEADAQSALDAYQNYIINQVPVVFFPLPFTVAAVSSKLGGYQPNTYDFLNPESWSLHS